MGTPKQYLIFAVAIVLLIAVSYYYDLKPQFSPPPNHSIIQDIEHAVSQAEFTQNATPQPVFEEGKEVPEKDLDLQSAPFIHSMLEDPEAIIDHDERYIIPNYETSLGFNNIRYILEHHVYYAYILNRTLIIPDTIHLRSCYHPSICSLVGTQIKDRSSGQPVENSWTLPIEYFFDIPNLRKHIKVVTIKEFIELQIKKLESKQHSEQNDLLIARWNQLVSHPNMLENLLTDSSSMQYIFPQLSYLTNNMWNFLHSPLPGNVVVDDIEPLEKLYNKTIAPKNDNKTSHTVPAKIYGFANLPSMTIDMEEIYNVNMLPPDQWNSPYRSAIAYENTHTSKLRPEMGKHRQHDFPLYLSPVGFTGLKQFWSRFENISLLHLDGSGHEFGKHPLRFSTMRGREIYNDVVLRWLRYSEAVRKAADFAIKKLEMRIETGQPFLSFHVRMGDFVTYGFNGDKLSSGEGIARVIKKTRKDLEASYIKESAKKKKDKKNPSRTLSNIYYIATDEKNPKVLESIMDAGAVQLVDLLSGPDQETKEFWDENYQLASFGDWLGLIDQIVCSRSWFFVGSTMSSVTGGIFNLRKGLGMSPWLTGYISDWEN